MFTVKCEGLTITDSSAFQITGLNPTGAQIVNISLVNVLWYLSDSIWNLMDEFDSTEAGDFLFNCCEVSHIKLII